NDFQTQRIHQRASHQSSCEHVKCHGDLVTLETVAPAAQPYLGCLVFVLLLLRWVEPTLARTNSKCKRGNRRELRMHLLACLIFAAALAHRTAIETSASLPE